MFQCECFYLLFKLRDKSSAIYCNIVVNQYTFYTMTENDVKTVLKIVLADQKKTTAYLKKLFAYSPKESDAIDAELLAKKLDKASLAGLLIEAVQRFQGSMDVMQRAAVQIDLYKDEMIKSQKKIEKLQDKLITSQEESLEKLTKSAETLAGVSEVVKGDVQELVEQKRTYAELVAKREDSAEESLTVAKREAPTTSALKQAMKEANQEDERQRSVIISGIADGFNGNEKKYELDLMFSHMSISHLQHQVLSVVYIGKQYKPKSGGSDCRLVRVIFSSIAGARQCIRESKELKGDEKWGNVYINPDRTAIERAEMKKLVAQMKAEIAKDDSVFWTISNRKLVSYKKKE